MDEDKMDEGADRGTGHGPGSIEVRFTPDEMLALYAQLSQRVAGDGPWCVDTAVLASALSRLKARLELSMQVSTALLRNRRTRPLAELITAALDEVKRGDKREAARLYLADQQHRVDALKDECVEIDQQALELREAKRAEDEDMLELLLDDDAAPAREYPRRRPPPPVMPAMRRGRARRRGRGQTPQPAQDRV